jgi:L-aspartate oxidase
MPRPLLSEALRGHGALLRDAAGERFVDELAARDVVARAMAGRMAEQGVEHLWLDATPLERFDERFPTIAAALRHAGLDPAVDWLPIAPAAHYLIGGVVTDLDGATTLPGLWAAGEVACTGVHGANRLASNSLLEGMVFGGRVVEAITAGRDGPEATGVMGALRRGEVLQAEAPVPGGGAGDLGKLREIVQHAMTVNAGVRRDAASLARAAQILETATPEAGPESVEANELANLAITGSALLAAATLRQESRGTHNRSDHPETSPDFARRVVLW